MNTQLCRLLAVGVAASIASACSSLPETVPELTSARMKVNELNTEPLALQVAGDDLDEARTQLGIAEEVYEDDGDIEILEHHAYMAATHAEIGLQRIAEETAREELRSSEACAAAFCSKRERAKPKQQKGAPTKPSRQHSVLPKSSRRVKRLAASY